MNGRLGKRTSPVLVSSEREGSGIGSRVCTIGQLLGHFRKPAFALLPLIPQATPTNLSTEAGDPSAIQRKAIQADKHQQRNRFFDQTALGRESRSTAYHTCWKVREIGPLSLSHRLTHALDIFLYIISPK